MSSTTSIVLWAQSSPSPAEPLEGVRVQKNIAVSKNLEIQKYQTNESAMNRTKIAVQYLKTIFEDDSDAKKFFEDDSDASEQSCS